MVKCLPVRVRTQTGVIGKIHIDKEIKTYNLVLKNLGNEQFRRDKRFAGKHIPPLLFAGTCYKKDTPFFWAYYHFPAMVYGAAIFCRRDR